MAFIGVATGAIGPTIADQMSEMLASFASWGPDMAKLGNQEGFVALMIYMLGLMENTKKPSKINIIMCRRVNGG